MTGKRKRGDVRSERGKKDGKVTFKNFFIKQPSRPVAEESKEGKEGKEGEEGKEGKEAEEEEEEKAEEGEEEEEEEEEARLNPLFAVTDPSAGEPAAAPAADLRHSWVQLGSFTHCFVPSEEEASEEDAKAPKKVLGVDLDGTLIRVASGRKWPKDHKDWVWWHPSVPRILRKYAAEGHRIIIFTNQGSVQKKRSPEVLETLKRKIQAIVKALGIPSLQVGLAGGYDHFRKPSPELWLEMLREFNRGLKPSEIRPEDCLYVGDAAGRHKNWIPKAKKDFAASDRMFAANLGIPFQTPEEFFLQKPPVPRELWSWGKPSPSELLEAARKKLPFGDKEKELLLHGGAAPVQEGQEVQEVVVLVGPPASGKSTLFQRYFAPRGYVWVNRDTHGTPARCLKILREALTEGKSVVVDNTNAQKSQRAPYIRAAQEAKVRTRCVNLDVEKDLVMHLNLYRAKQTKGKRAVLPAVAIHTFFKRREPPELQEGFQHILNIPFHPEFQTPEEEQAFLQWT